MNAREPGRVTVSDLQKLTREKTRWGMLTSYDAVTARIFEDAGIPALLVGDSAAMSVLGYDSTLPVSMEEMLMFTRAVVRGTRKALIIADMPFGSYQVSVEKAIENAALLMQAGAGAVKLEGGIHVTGQIRALQRIGIPVIGHIGLTPQSVNQLDGYKIQGRGEDAKRILEDAHAVEDAGASMIVLETIPSKLGETITKELQIPTIGIGAGNQTSAQVLVWQDLLGLTPQPHPRFVNEYLNMRTLIRTAVSVWQDDVKTGETPNEDQDYK